MRVNWWGRSSPAGQNGCSWVSEGHACYKMLQVERRYSIPAVTPPLNGHKLQIKSVRNEDGSDHKDIHQGLEGHNQRASGRPVQSPKTTPLFRPRWPWGSGILSGNPRQVAPANEWRWRSNLARNALQRATRLCKSFERRILGVRQTGRGTHVSICE